jgi:ABC-type uncharacterized transport system ATPase subunit
MVHQHSTLADNLSVLDNVMLGTEPLVAAVVGAPARRRRLLDTARRFGLPVEPDARVAACRSASASASRSSRRWYRGARILILDEPTAVLTRRRARRCSPP